MKLITPDLSTSIWIIIWVCLIGDFIISIIQMFLHLNYLKWIHNKRTKLIKENSKNWRNIGLKRFKEIIAKTFVMKRTALGI